MVIKGACGKVYWALDQYQKDWGSIPIDGHV